MVHFEILVMMLSAFAFFTTLGLLIALGMED